MPLGEKEAMMWWDKPVIPSLGGVKVFGSEIQGQPQLPLVSKRQSKQRPSKLFFLGGVSSHLCSPDYPATSSVDQAVLKLRDLPVSAS